MNELAVREPIRIGFLAGDFPWSAPPPQVGKLLSGGVMARNITRALSLFAQVTPYVSPHAASEAEQRTVLTTFLSSIDLLWADVYPGRTAEALTLRQELDLRFRVILNAQGAVPKALDAMLFPWQSLLRPGDGIVFTCAADRTIWRNLVHRSALQEWVAPLPIDEMTFYPRSAGERFAARERLGVSAFAPLLLYVGRLNIQKNLHALLRLLAAVRREIPDACLCCIGAEDDIVFGEFRVTNTGYVPFLHALADELGVAGAVRICGPQFGEDLAQAYAAADVLVNASFYHRENFGLSQAEAQACGTPVVCSDWGGFKDVIIPGETGDFMETVLTKNGIRVDWASGASCVCALLQDPERRARTRARSAARAHDQFSISAVARRLQEIVQECLQSPGMDRADSGPAYEPSRFAEEYEAHKRACGWYEGQRKDDPPNSKRSMVPRMFEGANYTLYERMMRPYVTRLAEEIAVAEFQMDWIPYVPSGIHLDDIRRTVRSTDPVWSHEQRLTLRAWEVLRRVDGTASAGRIAEILQGTGAIQDASEVMSDLWNLHTSGFVLFAR